MMNDLGAGSARLIPRPPCPHECGFLQGGGLRDRHAHLVRRPPTGEKHHTHAPLVRDGSTSLARETPMRTRT